MMQTDDTKPVSFMQVTPHYKIKKLIRQENEELESILQRWFIRYQKEGVARIQLNW